MVKRRKHIGLIGPEPKGFWKAPEGVSAEQQRLREDVLRSFVKKIIKDYAVEQERYIEADPEMSESIKYLFDEHGNPPANAPLEDIVRERKALEVNIRWLEAITVSLAWLLDDTERDEVIKAMKEQKGESMREMLWNIIRIRFKEQGIKNVKDIEVSINANRSIMKVVLFLFRCSEQSDAADMDKKEIEKTAKRYIKELNAIIHELKAHLLKIKEIEDAAFLYLEKAIM
jgi:hypothetical protein